MNDKNEKNIETQNEDNNQELNFKEKAVKFLDRQGVYMVLAICLAVVAVTAVFTSDTGSNPKDAPTNNTSQNDSLALVPQETDSQSTATEPKASEKPEKIELSRPIEGECIRPFAQQALVYNQTLKQWGTHNGIDIAGKIGTDVKSALGGVVESVKQDPMLGTVVIIKHDNGSKTLYANLEKEPVVKEQQKVKQGDVLGKIGKTAISEYDDDEHIHFEYWVGDKAVDPLLSMTGISVRKVEEKPLEQAPEAEKPQPTPTNIETLAPQEGTPTANVTVTPTPNTNSFVPGN